MTPVIGKILFKLLNNAKNKITTIRISSLFDENTDDDERTIILEELKRLGCINDITENTLHICNVSCQISINPYSDFFDIEDGNYISDLSEMYLLDTNEHLIIKDTTFENAVENIREFALGSKGQEYEEKLYSLISDNFPDFTVKWYGANATGQRLSDIAILTKIFNGTDYQNIVIIIECKAGNAIKSYDERKEIDDVINTLMKLSKSERIDGVWYWIVNGNSLPSVDSHGGYRTNALSKNLLEKLNDIHFSISETMRVPTIITGFSFDAIKSYLCYLHEKISNTQSINRVTVPHFWRWSKKFMNMQYVMVHKELRMDM